MSGPLQGKSCRPAFPAGARLGARFVNPAAWPTSRHGSFPKTGDHRSAEPANLDFGGIGSEFSQGQWPLHATEMASLLDGLVSFQEGC